MLSEHGMKDRCWDEGSKNTAIRDIHSQFGTSSRTDKWWPTHQHGRAHTADSPRSPHFAHRSEDPTPYVFPDFGCANSLE